jgi:hypothetical protein
MNIRPLLRDLLFVISYGEPTESAICTDFAEPINSSSSWSKFMASSKSSGKRGVGRPRKRVNRKLLKQLAEAQLTMAEISAITKVSVDTLKRNFADVIDLGRESGVGSMKRALFRAGSNTRRPNVAAQRFYLMNYGGMKDAHEHSGPGGAPIPIEISSAEENEQRIAELLAKAKKVDGGNTAVGSVGTEPKRTGGVDSAPGGAGEVPGSQR